MKENENVMENDDEIEIDLGGIFHALLHWLWLILVVALAAGVLGYSIARFVLPAEYESTTSIYVLDRSSGESTTYSDLQVSSQLTADYQELIKSRYVIEKTIDDLDLASQGFTYDSLYRAISVESPSNTHILVVTVTDTSDLAREQAGIEEAPATWDQLIEDAGLDAHGLLLGHILHQFGPTAHSLAREGGSVEHRSVLQKAQLLPQVFREAQG